MDVAAEWRDARAMSGDRRDRWATWKVLGTMGGVAALAIGAMCWWGAVVVRGWAHEKDAEGAEVGYSVPGTFGDAFAPIVGVLTSLALGAAIASVLMQRRELELQRDEMKAQRDEMAEARKQWTAQAASMAEANKHAARANELAHSAQMVEVSRLIAELDDHATDAVQEVKDRHPNHAQLQKCDPGGLWYEFAESTPERRAQHMPREINTAQLRAFAKRRGDLDLTLGLLRAGMVRNPEREQMFINVAEET